ncbi:deoxyribonuclease Tat-D [[Candida] railenensis]|uniref:Deoxyribonuclease Tat-D n=1 Tax=[Candida] railenensis TaxID=45579 RepID=A0A9P0QTY5_9ASCO|nr:deoxyribonuclease Tat-D [[Candida] railenensis]
MRSIRKMWKPRYFDIGVNFSDSMFQGRYHGSSEPKHPPDISRVVERAKLFNVENILITASSIAESKEHFELCETYKNFHSTVGVHPCTVQQEFYSSDISVDSQLSKLSEIATQGIKLGHIKAFGEIGLDYDRLHYTPVDQQKEMFQKQLELFTSLKLGLPFFLHMRAACDDFISIIEPFVKNFALRGVVHSFTGTEEELRKLLELGFYIGVNGCSLKTEENLNVIAKIPKDKILIETDAPWCEIRKSHASHKYISPYPNVFYPELQIQNETSEPSVLSGEPDSSNSSASESNTTKKKKNTPKPKVTIKFDDFLPFPVVKKGNFSKHATLAEAHAKEHNKVENLFSDATGPLAWPLMQSRNEPVFVGYVAEILCSIYGIQEEKEIQKFIDSVYENSCNLFNLPILE